MSSAEYTGVKTAVSVSLGDLRERIEICTLAKTPGTNGITTKGYTTVATVWAKVISIRPRPFSSTGVVLDSGITHRFVIRRSAYDVRKEHRLKWNSRLFIVSSMRDLGEKRTFLEIYAAEEGAA